MSDWSFAAQAESSALCSKVRARGTDFECLDTGRDARSPRKELKPGDWLLEIEATDRRHRSLPLWCEVFATKASDYVGGRETPGQIGLPPPQSWTKTGVYAVILGGG